MNNQEKKKEFWEKLRTKYTHLLNYCEIAAHGLDDDNIYFHPVFKINENTYISSQCDIGHNNDIYALNFYTENPENFNITIDNSLLDSVIIGYHTNRDIVLLALNTLYRVRNHISQLNNYTTDYIINILLGNSIQEVTKQFISELQATNQIVSFMQNTKQLKEL